jgi:hypothetical protein
MPCCFAATNAGGQGFGQNGAQGSPRLIALIRNVMFCHVLSAGSHAALLEPMQVVKAAMHFVHEAMAEG